MPELTGSQQTAGQTASRPKKRVTVTTRILRVCLALGIAGALVWAGMWVYEWRRPSEQVFVLAQRALVERNYAAAEKYAKRLASRNPNSKQAFLIRGTIATYTNKPEEALEWFDKIPNDRTGEAADARSSAAYVMIGSLHQPAQALREVQRGYDVNSNNVSANVLIPEILRLGTRAWETVPYEYWINTNGEQFGVVSAQHLRQVSLGHEVHPPAELLKACAETAPDDPIVQMGLADVALSEKRYDEAETHYRRVIASNPEILEAKVRLGQVLVDENSATKFYQWNATLPKEAEAHPLTWAIRGEWADAHGEPKVAMRCYWETVRIDPNHQPAVDRLGKLLIAEKRPDDANFFVERAQKLDLYLRATKAAEKVDENSEPDIRAPWEAANCASQLGLMAEALAWVALTLHVDPAQKEALDAAKQIQKNIQKAPTQRTVPGVNPTIAVDLTNYPRPNWTAGGPAADKPAGDKPAADKPAVPSETPKK